MTVLPESKLQTREWMFWSTRESINNDVPSVMAILETFAAIYLYWWVAIRFQTYLPLLLSAAIAPLVLLRSDESVALGVRWFLGWERFWLGGFDFHELTSDRRRVALNAGLCSAALGGAVVSLSMWFLVLNVSVWGMPQIATIIALAAIIGAGLGVGAVVGNTSVADLVAAQTAIIMSFAVAAVVGVVALFALREIDLPIIWFIALVGAAAGAGAFAGSLLVVFAVPIFLLGFALGVFCASLVVRVGATCNYLVFGFRSLPTNFRRLALCTSPAQIPELVPGLPPKETQFTLVSVLEQLGRQGEPPLAYRKRRAAWYSRVGYMQPLSLGLIIWPLAILVWFVPAWLYRITLKSTAWFWWPLAFFLGDLRRAKEPRRFRRKVIGTLWAKSSIAISLLVIGSFLFSNLVLTGAVLKGNQFLTFFGYFLLVDWSFRVWQILPLIIAVLSIIIVLWLDDVIGDYEDAEEINNVLLLNHFGKKLGWIERVMRLRLVLVVSFWLLIGGHAFLQFNSLKCWLIVPTNVKSWGEWIYKERMPTLSCPS